MVRNLLFIWLYSLANSSSVLKLETLLKLSESTSYDLRAAYVIRYLYKMPLKTDSRKGFAHYLRAIYERANSRFASD